MGMGMEPEIFLRKNLPASAGKLFLRIASESEKVFVCEDFWRIFGSPKNKRFLDGQFKLLWPCPLPLYFDIENDFILSPKSVLDGYSQC